MEKELLAIVMVFKEFRSMLLGARLTVNADHRNLTYHNLTSSRVLRWRLLLDEYDATFLYLPGKDNALGDAFSRLPRLDATEGKSALSDSDSDPLESFFSFTDSKTMLELFLNLPAPNVMRNPTAQNLIQENQFEDEALNRNRTDHPQRYPVRDVSGIPLIHYRRFVHLDNDESHWKIAIPSAIMDNLVRWFHSILGHAGETRVYDSIRAQFHHLHLKKRVEEIISSCKACRKYKLSGPGHGELAARDVEATPWLENHVDLIGPWKVKVNNIHVEFNALTVINPVTNLTELICIEDKTSSHVAQQYSNVWLSRYPWPKVCVHDNGGEFIGLEFQQLLEQCNIRPRPTTSRNPQSNAICERMHQTVGNILRTLLHGEPITPATAPQIVDNALATCCHSLRTAVSRSLLNYSPGELAFHRHMFLNLPILADLQALHDKRGQLVQKNLAVMNKRRVCYDFQPGQNVGVKDVNTKIGPHTLGPFPTTQVHTNGTVTILQRPGVTERINIRRLIPLP